MKRVGYIVLALVLSAIGLGIGPASAGTSSVALASYGDVRIIEYGPNAPGADTAAKRNYEFLRLKNMTAAAINVEGWWVQDSYPHVYKLEGVKLPATSPFRDAGTDTVKPSADDQFVIPVGGQVYVYNGAGADGNPTNLTAALYRDYIHHFNNAGDTLYVKASNGGTVHRVTYTPYRVYTG
jgi:hypothetical protein